MFFLLLLVFSVLMLLRIFPPLFPDPNQQNIAFLAQKRKAEKSINKMKRLQASSMENQTTKQHT